MVQVIYFILLIDKDKQEFIRFGQYFFDIKGCWLVLVVDFELTHQQIRLTYSIERKDQKTSKLTILSKKKFFNW